VVFASYGGDPPGYDCFEPYVPPDVLRVPRSPCQREYDQRTDGRYQQPPPPPDLAPGQTPLDTLELIIQAVAPDPSQAPEAASALLDLRILEATDRALQAVGGGRYRAARDGTRRALDAIRERIPGSRGRDRDRDRPPVRAPGRYVDKDESMSDASRRYQQAQGAQPGKAFRVDGPDVDFDAVQDGVLIDAKGRYDQLLDKSFTPMVEDKLVQQAARQVRAAGATPVQWRFAEPEAARRVRRLLRENDLPEVDVRHVPPP
jgi:hypothetical protein